MGEEKTIFIDSGYRLGYLNSEIRELNE